MSRSQDVKELDEVLVPMIIFAPFFLITVCYLVGKRVQKARQHGGKPW